MRWQWDNQTRLEMVALSLAVVTGYIVYEYLLDHIGPLAARQDRIEQVGEP